MLQAYNIEVVFIISEMDQSKYVSFSRSFDDQMRRNERIFKKMFKESGVGHQYSDTDSDEERARAHVNKKAVKRWRKKKQLQHAEEQQKLAMVPLEPGDNVHKQSLGDNLLLIGDTSMGEKPPTESGSYIQAYTTYTRESRAKSADSRATSAFNKSIMKGIDPVTYEEWVSTKHSIRGVANSSAITNASATRNKRTLQLTKQIDYNTWLAAANKRINKEHLQRKRNEKYEKDFKEWIQELKDEVGTYEYWKRKKEEQINKEKELQKHKKREEERRASESERRKSLAKDIYKHWAVNKELSQLQKEEQKLRKEKERLVKLKENKGR